MHPCARYPTPQESVVKVEPSSGFVPAKGKQVLKIECVPSRAGKFDAHITLSILGAKNLVHILTGQTVPVNVALSQQLFDFAHVRVGQVCRMPFSITNNTACSVDLEVNFSQAVCFLLLSFSLKEALLTRSLSL